MPLTTVYISGPRGQYATNVDAVSSHDAVRKAVEFFLDPFWRGPKPMTGTVLRVCPMGGMEIRVRVSFPVSARRYPIPAPRTPGALILDGDSPSF